MVFSVHLENIPLRHLVGQARGTEDQLEPDFPWDREKKTECNTILRTQ